MKRSILIIMLFASVAFAQAPTSPYQNTLFLDTGTMSWKNDTLNSSSDTLVVSAAQYILPLQCPGGFGAIEGKAIFTANTDSMKGVLYVCNYPNGLSSTRDTMRLFAVDSCKLLASGSGVNVTMRGTSFHWVFAINGDFGIWATVKWIPLNTTTGKITQQSLGRQ